MFKVQGNRWERDKDMFKVYPTVFVEACDIAGAEKAAVKIFKAEGWDDITTDNITVEEIEHSNVFMMC